MLISSHKIMFHMYHTRKFGRHISSCRSFLYWILHCQCNLLSSSDIKYDAHDQK